MNKQKKEFSIYRYQFWMQRGLSETEAKQKVSIIQKENVSRLLKKIKPEYSHFKKEYWMIKKGLNENDAKRKVSELQSRLSFKSKKFKGKVRTEESKIKISNSMKAKIAEIGPAKWASHFGEFNGNSKIEKSFYFYIKENINENISSNVPIERYVVDILDNTNKIVEFYGDFWHANPKFYKSDDRIKSFQINKTSGQIWEYDRLRLDFLNRLGYDVLVIWENDWLKNKSDCIEKIKKFYENVN